MATSRTDRPPFPRLCGRKKKDVCFSFSSPTNKRLVVRRGRGGGGGGGGGSGAVNLDSTVLFFHLHAVWGGEEEEKEGFFSAFG